MVWLTVAMLLAACGGRDDPELAQLGAAVDGWTQGAAALDAGDAATARRRFAEARDHRGEDALLIAWEAKAAAAEGELDQALALLDQAVQVSPRFGPARALRASYRARRGEVADAAIDITAALDAGTWTPRQALRDPDIAAVAGHPALSMLPAAAFELRWDVPDRLAFAGTRVDVDLEVVGAVEGPVSVHGGVAGPAMLVRVVEDDRGGPEGDRVRSLRWTLEVTGPGGLTVGPLEVRQGASHAISPATSVATDAPPGWAAGARDPMLRAPSAILGDHVPPTSWVEGEGAWIALPPGATSEPSGDGVERVIRQDGDPVASIVWVPGVVATVRIVHQGTVLWSAAPTSP